MVYLYTPEMTRFQDHFSYLSYRSGELWAPQYHRRDETHWGYIYDMSTEWAVTISKSSSTSLMNLLGPEKKVDPDVDYNDLEQPQHFHVFLRNPWQRLRSQLNHFTNNIRREYGYSVNDLKLFNMLTYAGDTHVHPAVSAMPVRNEYYDSKQFGKRNWKLNSEILNFVEYMDSAKDTYTFTTFENGDDAVQLFCDHYNIEREQIKDNTSESYIAWPQGFPAEQDYNQQMIIDLCNNLYSEDIKLWEKVRA